MRQGLLALRSLPLVPAADSPASSPPSKAVRRRPRSWREQPSPRGIADRSISWSSFDSGGRTSNPGGLSPVASSPRSTEGTQQSSFDSGSGPSRTSGAAVEFSPGYTVRQTGTGGAAGDGAGGAGDEWDPEGLLLAWRAAGDAGDATAQYLLGMAFHEGRGARPCQHEAARWFAAAAAQGHQAAHSAHFVLMLLKNGGLGLD